MTNSELSNEFDVLYNNITSNQAPGLDEYEKSVFLTKAQDEVVKAYFSPELNKSQKGFDDSLKRQADFSMLIRTQGEQTFNDGATLDNRSNTKVVKLKNDVMFVLNEFADVTREGKEVRLVVLPIKFTDYMRFMSKPFKRPLKNQAWRLINGEGNDSELIIGSNDTLQKYTYRYVKRPNAIILPGLGTDVTLDGVSTEQPCELDPILHQEILQRAVELAKAAYVGDLASQTGLSSASQTNIGAVAQSR